MDLDRNGLPDLWERNYFGVIGVDGRQDHDGDGRTTLQEWIEHTNPTNSTSCFRQQLRVQTNALTVDFGPMSSDHVYSLEFATSLVDADWSVLTNGTLQTLGVSNSVSELIPDDPSGYYRISATPSVLSSTGRRFYVANAGSDFNDGLSPAAPWQTIAHVVDADLLPGDSVLFKRGDVWRENLYVDDSGSPEQWITYSAYGTGPKPRILGSEAATGWTNVTGSIWMADGAFDNLYGGGYDYAEVFFEEQDGSFSWGHQRSYDAGFSAMMQERDWCWNNDRIYVYCVTNPAVAYIGVEVPQRSNCIRFPSISGSYVTPDDVPHHIAFDNLQVMFSQRQGIYSGYNEAPIGGFRFTHCHIGCIGIKGGASAYGIATWFSDVLIENCVFHDIGRRSISYNTYTDNTADLTVSNVVINANHFYNGYHTTSVDLSCLPELTHTYTNFTFSSNLVNDLDIDDFEGETSNQLYAEAHNSLYTDFYIHHNVFLGATARAILMNGVHNMRIYHNTIYGNHPDADPYSLITLTDCDDVDLRNNIVSATLIDPPHPSRCVLDQGSTGFALRDRNLYHQLQYSQPVTGSENGVGGWDVHNTEWDSWTVASGFELSSPVPQDPLFTDPENRGIHLLLGSPAIDAGTVIPGVNEDYRGNAPDLGAMESLYFSGQADTNAPSIPGGLSAAALSDSQVRISWNAALDNVQVAGYRIYRDGSQVGVSTILRFTDSGLSAETAYSYAVSAFDAAGNSSAMSTNISITTLDPSAPPVTSSVTASSYENDGVNVNPPENAADGDLGTRWSAEGDGEWLQFASPTQRVFNTVSIAFHRGDLRQAFFDVAVSDDAARWTVVLTNAASSGGTTALQSFSFPLCTNHYFRLVGHGNSDSDWNSYNEVEWAYVPPDVTPPSQPQNLSVSAESFYSASLTWIASSDDRDVAGYYVYRDGEAAGSSTSASYTDESLSAETTYSFAVAAYDDAGNVSTNSATVQVTTPAIPAASTYYVSNVGNDANDGLSPSNAWQSISHVNGQSFNPGDFILFERGGVWRETLVLGSSGADVAWITYGAYGSGERPEILGSTRLSGWEAVPGYPNVWRSTTGVPNPFDYYASEIWFETTNGVEWASHVSYGYDDEMGPLTNLTAEFEVTWIGDPAYNADGSIYVFCAENPSVRYAAVEVPVRDSAIELNDQEYIAIENIGMHYTLERGVNERYSPSYNLSGLKITGCDVGWIGIKDGSNMYGLNVRHSNMILSGNEIHDCGRRSVSLVVYDTTPAMTIQNVLIESNRFYNGFHTTGLDCNNTGGHTISNVTVRYNRFEGHPTKPLDNWYTTDEVEGDPNSNSIFIANQGAAGSYVGGIRIYGNLFTWSLASSIKLESVDRIEVFNNTFYNFNETLSNIQGHVYNSSIAFPITRITIQNNIFVSNSDPLSSTPAHPCVKWDADFAGELTINNNLYWSEYGSTGWMFRVHDGANYRIEDWNDYLTAYPLFDTGSPAPSAPLFADAEHGDYSISTNSPAYHAGAPVSGITTDFAGNPYHPATPSVGAFEVLP